VTSLPNDLVKKIGDIFLSMDDLNYYSNFRDVCGGSRGALSAEPPFMLTKWINLEHSLSRDDLVDDAAVTLLNVSIGRCLLKKIRNLIRRCLSSTYGFTQFGLYLSDQIVRQYSCHTLIFRRLIKARLLNQGTSMSEKQHAASSCWGREPRRTRLGCSTP
jgi:hypothetical protein